MKLRRKARFDAIGHVLEVRDELLTHVEDLLELFRVLTVKVDFLEGEEDALFYSCLHSVLAKLKRRVFIMFVQ